MGRLSPERPLPNVPRPLRCGRSCSLSWGRATVWDVKRRRAAPLFIPLLGERVGACPGLDPGVRGLRIPVPRASTAPSFSALLGTYKGWGEGSSGQPSLGLRKRLLWARVGVRVFRAQCHPSARPAGPRSRLLIPLLGERVGVRGLPGNRPWVTQRSPPEAELLADLGRRPAGQGPQHGRPRGVSGSPAEPPAGRHSLSHGWRMREPMACWIRPHAKVRGGPSAAVVTTYRGPRAGGASPPTR